MVQSQRSEKNKYQQKKKTNTSLKESQYTSLQNKMLIQQRVISKAGKGSACSVPIFTQQLNPRKDSDGRARGG